MTLGNGGDAAIFLGVERALRAALPPFQLAVFETQPEVAREAFPEYDIRTGLSSVAWPQIAKGIPARARRVLRWLTMRPRLLAAARAWRAGRRDLALRLAGDEGPDSFRTVAEADVVVSTGGTYFVPAYWLGLRYLEFDVLQALGQPYVLFTQSVGPFDTMPKERLKPIFEGARVMMLRGQESEDSVLAIAPATHTTVRADAAFSLADADRLAAAAEREWPSSPLVAVSVRDWPHFVTVDSDAGMARYRRVRRGRPWRGWSARTMRVRPVPLDVPGHVRSYRYDDSATALAVVRPAPGRRAGAPSRWTAPSTTSRTPCSRGLRRVPTWSIATRMHAAILALCAGDACARRSPTSSRREELFDDATAWPDWVERHRDDDARRLHRPTTDRVIERPRRPLAPTSSPASSASGPTRWPPARSWPRRSLGRSRG